MIKGAIGRTVRLGIKSLMLHKLRSMLTTLGVLFGVSSVIAMLAIGEGGSVEAQEQIRRLGSQNVILRAIKPPEDLASNRSTRVVQYGLTESDLRRIETFPWAGRIVPVRQLQQEIRVGDRVLNPRVMGTTPDYIEVTGRIIAQGRFLSAQDEASAQNVCVIGYEIARYLFPFEDPINQDIKIGAEYYRVVGTLIPRVPLSNDPPKPGEDVTGEVLIPLNNANKWFGNMQVKIRSGSREMEEVELHEIIVEVEEPNIEEPKNVPRMAAACRDMLRRFHTQVDYEVVVPLELLLRAQETKRIFNIVLGSIAGISLLVGGIGIMNVMLATVLERTREIGIRRALGAKRRHIVVQFLVETVVLSVGGGVLGILLGLAIPFFVERFAKMQTVVTPGAPVLAFGISVAIGIIFGLYPAWRAANMDPVEALRYE
ncbi:MAG: hypothetical protein DWQ01_01925 [Planctomycetota bacterium]|nr:MAG: hypothetical protein DWQ01_01925 [Planctomycetota bacterium]